MAGKDPSKLTKAELVQLVKKQDGEVADKAAQLAASEAKATQLRNTLDLLKEKAAATGKVVEQYQQLAIRYAEAEKQLKKERAARLKLQKAAAAGATSQAGEGPGAGAESQAQPPPSQGGALGQEGNSNGMAAEAQERAEAQARAAEAQERIEAQARAAREEVARLRAELSKERERAQAQLQAARGEAEGLRVQLGQERGAREAAEQQARASEQRLQAAQRQGEQGSPQGYGDQLQQLQEQLRGAEERVDVALGQRQASERELQVLQEKLQAAERQLAADQQQRQRQGEQERSQQQQQLEAVQERLRASEQAVQAVQQQQEQQQRTSQEQLQAVQERLRASEQQLQEAQQQLQARAGTGDGRAGQSGEVDTVQEQLSQQRRQLEEAEAKLRQEREVWLREKEAAQAKLQGEREAWQRERVEADGCLQQERQAVRREKEEVEGQLRQQLRQREAAEASLRQQLEALQQERQEEEASLRQQLEAVQQERDDAEEQFEQEQERADSLAAQLRRVEAEAEEAAQQLERGRGAAEESVARLQRERDDAVAEATDLRRTCTSQQERLRQMEQQLEQHVGQAAGEGSGQLRQRQHEEQLQALVQAAERERQQLQRQSADMQRQLDAALEATAAAQQQLQQLEEEGRRACQRAQAGEAEVARLRQRLLQEEEECGRLQQQLQEAEEGREAAERQQQCLQQQLQEAEEGREAAERQQQCLQQQLREAEKRRETAEQQLRQQRLLQPHQPQQPDGNRVQRGEGHVRQAAQGEGLGRQPLEVQGSEEVEGGSEEEGMEWDAQGPATAAPGVGCTGKGSVEQGEEAVLLAVSKESSQQGAAGRVQRGVAAVGEQALEGGAGTMGQALVLYGGAAAGAAMAAGQAGGTHVTAGQRAAAAAAAAAGTVAGMVLAENVASACMAAAGATAGVAPAGQGLEQEGLEGQLRLLRETIAAQDAKFDQVWSELRSYRTVFHSIAQSAATASRGLPPRQPSDDASDGGYPGLAPLDRRAGTPGPGISAPCAPVPVLSWHTGAPGSGTMAGLTGNGLGRAAPGAGPGLSPGSGSEELAPARQLGQSVGGVRDAAGAPCVPGAPLGFGPVSGRPTVSQQPGAGLAGVVGNTAGRGAARFQPLVGSAPLPIDDANGNRAPTLHRQAALECGSALRSRSASGAPSEVASGKALQQPLSHTSGGAAPTDATGAERPMRSDSGAWLHAAGRPLSHGVEGQPRYLAAHAQQQQRQQQQQGVSGQTAHVRPAVPGPQQLLAHQALSEHQPLQHQKVQQIWQVQVEKRPAEHEAACRDLAIADEDVDGYQHGAAAADVDWEQEQGQEESPAHTAYGEGTAAAPAHPPAAAEHGPSPAKKPRLWRPPPPASVAATAARQAQQQGGSSAAGLVIRGSEAGWAGARRALALGTAPRMPQSVGIGIPQAVPGVQAAAELRLQAQVQQNQQQAQHRSFAQQQQQHQEHQHQQQQRGNSAMLLAPAWLAALGPPPQESPRRKRGPGRPRKVTPPSELLLPLTQGTASGRAATGKTVAAAARKLRDALAAGDWPLEVLVVALQQAMLSCAAPHVTDAGGGNTAASIADNTRQHAAAAPFASGGAAAVEVGAGSGLVGAGAAGAAVSGWMQWARASAQQRGTLQVLAACALQLDATAGAPDGKGHDGAAVSQSHLAHGTGAGAAQAQGQLINATGAGAEQSGWVSGGSQQDHGGAAGRQPGKVCHALLRRLHRCVCDPGTLSAPSPAAHGQQHGGPAGDLQQGWDGVGAYGLPLQQTERCALAAAHALLCREAGWLQEFRAFLLDMLAMATADPWPGAVPPMVAPLYTAISHWPQACAPLDLTQLPQPQTGSAGQRGSRAAVGAQALPAGAVDKDPVGYALHAALLHVLQSAARPQPTAQRPSARICGGGVGQRPRTPRGQLSRAASAASLGSAVRTEDALISDSLSGGTSVEEDQQVCRQLAQMAVSLLTALGAQGAGVSGEVPVDRDDWDVGVQAQGSQGFERQFQSCSAALLGVVRWGLDAGSVLGGVAAAAALEQAGCVLALLCRCAGFELAYDKVLRALMSWLPQLKLAQQVQVVTLVGKLSGSCLAGRQTRITEMLACLQLAETLVTSLGDEAQAPAADGTGDEAEQVAPKLQHACVGALTTCVACVMAGEPAGRQGEEATKRMLGVLGSLQQWLKQGCLDWGLLTADARSLLHILTARPGSS